MPPIKNPTPPTMYLGIDPGASGGLAVICGKAIPDTGRMPDTDSDVWDWVRRLAAGPSFSTAAFIERVNGFIGNGHPGSAMFKFGQSYGAMRMALTAARIPWEEVSPQTWQKAFALKRQKDEPKHRWKSRIKQKAQQLFPGVAVTLATADALLIAEYGRRKHEGQL